MGREWRSQLMLMKLCGHSGSVAPINWKMLESKQWYFAKTKYNNQICWFDSLTIFLPKILDQFYTHRLAWKSWLYWFKKNYWQCEKCEKELMKKINHGLWDQADIVPSPSSIKYCWYVNLCLFLNNCCPQFFYL